MSPKHYGIGGKDGRGRRDTRQVKLCQRRSQKRPQVSASVARAMPDPHVPASSSHPPPAGTSEGEDFLFLFFFTHGNLLPIRSDLKPRLQDLWWELNAQLQGRKCCGHGVMQYPPLAMEAAAAANILAHRRLTSLGADNSARQTKSAPPVSRLGCWLHHFLHL